MAQMMRLQPHADISLEVANTSAISQKVLNYELDIGLVEGEFQHADLEVLPWRDDTLTVFCSPQHPLAQQCNLSDDDLIQAQWILRETGSGTRQAFDRAMQGILPNLDVSLELQHTEAIKRAVEANLGIGCLSQITLDDAFKTRQLDPPRGAATSLRSAFLFCLAQAEISQRRHRTMDDAVSPARLS